MSGITSVASTPSIYGHQGVRSPAETLWFIECPAWPAEVAEVVSLLTRRGPYAECSAAAGAVSPTQRRLDDRSRAGTSRSLIRLLRLDVVARGVVVAVVALVVDAGAPTRSQPQ